MGTLGVMRPVTRFLAPVLLAAGLVLLPASAFAATPDGWCKGPGPCTSAPRATPAAEDGWCVVPTEICRRY